MRAKAQKWGNSLAVRIPKSIAQQAGVNEEDELDIDVEAEVIRLRPRRRQPGLAELLERVTPANLHSEADFGPAQGREPW
jgi:antitoxin MazE